MVMLCWSGSAHGQGGSCIWRHWGPIISSYHYWSTSHQYLCVHVHDRVWFVAVVVILDHNNSTVSLSFWWVMHVYRHMSQ